MAAGTVFAQEELPPLPASMMANQTEVVGELTIEEIRFDTGKTEISATDHARLKDMGERLKGIPVYVLLEAFTDAVGDEAKNQALSEARAASAAAAISEGGFSANQLIAIGYGKQYSKGETEGEKAEERRVTFTVLRLKSRPELSRRIVEEVRARGLKIRERAPPGAEVPVAPASPVAPPPPNPRPVSILAGLASGPNVVLSKLESSKPRTGPVVGVNVWRWSDETSVRVDLASQNATARYDDARGSLTRRYGGVGIDHLWWGRAFGGFATSVSGGVASYAFSPTSLDAVTSPDSWRLLTPAFQSVFYGFGFHPKLRLGGFLGLGIMADSLAISPFFTFGATFAW